MTEPGKTIVPEYNPQSRFLIIKGPLQLLPHKCATCSRGYATDMSGNTIDLEFFNCNLDLEFFGNLYLCVDCIREMGMQLGMVQAKDVKILESAYEEEADNSIKLQEENEELRHDLAGFRSLINTAVNPDDPGLHSKKAVRPENGSGEQKPGGEAKPAKDNGKLSNKPDSGKASTPKQDASEGSSDVFANLSLDDFNSDI